MKRIKQFERTDRDITNALLLLLERTVLKKSLWLRFLSRSFTELFFSSLFCN